MFVCVCVSENVRKREREKETERESEREIAACCRKLHSATQCNTVQHTATQYSFYRELGG